MYLNELQMPSKNMNECLGMKYRHLPTIVEAVQQKDEFEIITLEGTMKGRAGDYLVLGTAGERYPVKCKIFEATYEKV